MTGRRPRRPTSSRSEVCLASVPARTGKQFAAGKCWSQSLRVAIARSGQPRLWTGMGRLTLRNARLSRQRAVARSSIRPLIRVFIPEGRQRNSSRFHSFIRVAQQLTLT
jgi:hypothetical protein